MATIIMTEWMVAISNLVGGDGRELARLLLAGEPIPQWARNELAELVHPSDPPKRQARLVAKRVEWLTQPREIKHNAEAHAAMWFLHFLEDDVSRCEAVEAVRNFMEQNRKALTETHQYIKLPAMWDDAARALDKMVRKAKARKANRGQKQTP